MANAENLELIVQSVLHFDCCCDFFRAHICKYPLIYGNTYSDFSEKVERFVFLFRR